MDNLQLSVCWFSLAGPGEYGKKEFTEALSQQEVTLVECPHWLCAPPEMPFTLAVGTYQDRRMQVLLQSDDTLEAPTPESLFVQWCETQKGRVLALCGADEVGLMYLLLELARRIQVQGITALTEIKNFSESPENKVRCMDRYLLGHLDNEWFLSEAFWHYELSRLAKARFNRFCLIVGFDTAYMAPPYPYFLPVAGYEAVAVRGLSKEQQQENLQALRRIGALCHSYGLQFTFATWQQRPWTDEQDRLVDGLPESEAALCEYCFSGLRALCLAVEEIDIVQFRVNHESGVGTQVSAGDFWNRCTDAVAEAAKESGRPLILDLRAKGLTDQMVAHAFSRGLQVEIPTKYWCEHAALPYHLSIMRSEELAQLDNFNHARRYSYADLLKKPAYVDVLFRLWNYGSTNLFLWGDADYARRFSKSCHISGAIGFEVNAPLSLKYGHELSHKAPWPIFTDPGMRYAEWEDARFWMWYTVFGRLGYCADADPEIWQSEFATRFGKESAPLLERALATASKIVPMITTVHMPVHPSLRYWTELNTGWALFFENNLNTIQKYDFDSIITYGSTEPSDHGLFYGIDEYARDLVAGTLSGKYSPLQSAHWLEEFADETQSLLAEGLKRSPQAKGAELSAMQVDLWMLCSLARYHAEKMRAALALALWRLTEESTRLSDCALLLKRAIVHWDTLSENGKKYYYHDLDFSSAGSKTRRGTWGDLRCELEADEKTLAALLEKEGITQSGELLGDYLPGKSTMLQGTLPEKAPAREALTISIAAPKGGGVCTLHYRHLNQLEGVFRTLPMTESHGQYTATIPGEYLTGQWDLMVYSTSRGEDGAFGMVPGIYHESYPYPYHIVEIEEVQS